MIAPDFLSLLRCPLTRQTLAIADQVSLDRVKASLSPQSGPLDAALIREDRKVLYPIRAGIPVLLAEEALFLP